MWAPQPRSRVQGDTYAVPGLTEREPTPIDVRDPRTRSFGHIDPANMDPGKQTQDMLAVSASMRTAARAMSSRGWRTVVSWKTSQDAIGTSSNPRIETCEGTSMSSDRAASMVPKPMTSLNQKIAEGGSGSRSSTRPCW